MIMRSPLPNLQIPDLSVPAFILNRARERVDHPALIDSISGRTLSYTQLVDGAERVAGNLAARGFRPADVACIYSPNCLEFALAFYGIMLAGGVVSTVSPLATVDDLTHQRRDVNARVLFVSPALMGHARAADLDQCELFVFGEAAGAEPFAALSEPAAPLPVVSIDPDSLAVLPFSSGTTGLCKGVMLTHRNLVANILQVEAMQRIQPDERMIAILPFFHIYGMNVVLNLGLYRGATLVVCPKFEFESFLTLIEQYRITRAFVAPPCIVLLAKHPGVDRHDLSSMRVINCGAAPLDAALQMQCARRLSCEISQGYGMTEMSPVSHMSGQYPTRSRAGSVGLVVPGTESQVVDPESGRPLATGEDGEIWVRGPQVMRGYLKNPLATAAAVDPEGWLHTGDIGHFDADGFFFIVDRLKELIKYKGYQVPPAEIEAVLLTHPDVADAAVIGIPDETAGELPKAFVVRSGNVTAAELLQFVAEKVAPYKKVRLIEFIEIIPKSPSGKILRRILKERQTAGTARVADPVR